MTATQHREAVPRKTGRWAGSHSLPILANAWTQEEVPSPNCGDCFPSHHVSEWPAHVMARATQLADNGQAMWMDTVR